MICESCTRFVDLRVYLEKSMNKAPVIGVTPLWDAEKNSIWMLPEYLEGIRSAGGIPIILPLKADEESLRRLLAGCDGILFTGGQDVSPSLYGMEDMTGNVVSSPERDTMEAMLFRLVLETRKPVLGICRGLQLINALLGGTLWQDLPSEHPSELVHRQGKPYDLPCHPVTLSGSLKDLLHKDRLQVNALHHQAVRVLAPSLKPMAIAPDGIIEAAEMPGHPFLQAVQWHPEFLFRTDPDNLAIFQAFIRAESAK